MSTCRSLAHVAHPHQLARGPWSLRGEVCKAAVTLMHEALWLLRPAGIELCAALCTVESMIDKYLYQTVQALALCRFSRLPATVCDRLDVFVACTRRAGIIRGWMIRALACMLYISLYRVCRVFKHLACFRLVGRKIKVRKRVISDQKRLIGDLYRTLSTFRVGAFDHRSLAG